jgi:hypothetical protein
MPQDVELQCRCGEIHGWLRGVSPKAVNRAVCYCDDCQAFLHYIGRAELLDAHGGSDIVQAAPASVAFDRGTDRITAVRLSPKGLCRWYATCCKTPLGNTSSTPALPFVGIAHELFRGAPDARRRDEIFGPPRVAAYPQYAIGGVPPGSKGLGVGVILHIARLLLGWKLRGKTWPHPFFDRATKAPSHPTTTLSRAERDALRPLCGPHPARAR